MPQTVGRSASKFRKHRVQLSFCTVWARNSWLRVSARVWLHIWNIRKIWTPLESFRVCSGILWTRSVVWGSVVNSQRVYLNTGIHLKAPYTTHNARTIRIVRAAHNNHVRVQTCNLVNGRGTILRPNRTDFRNLYKILTSVTRRWADFDFGKDFSSI